MKKAGNLWLHPRPAFFLLCLISLDGNLANVENDASPSSSSSDSDLSSEDWLETDEKCEYVDDDNSMKKIRHRIAKVMSKAKSMASP